MARCLPLNNVEDVVPHIYDSQLFYNVWRQISAFAQKIALELVFLRVGLSDSGNTESA